MSKRKAGASKVNGHPETVRQQTLSRRQIRALTLNAKALVSAMSRADARQAGLLAPDPPEVRVHGEGRELRQTPRMRLSRHLKGKVCHAEGPATTAHRQRQKTWEGRMTAEERNILEMLRDTLRVFRRGLGARLTLDVTTREMLDDYVVRELMLVMDVADWALYRLEAAKRARARAGKHTKPHIRRMQGMVSPESQGLAAIVGGTRTIGDRSL